MATDKNRLIGALAAELQGFVAVDKQWQTELKRLEGFTHFDGVDSFNAQHRDALRLHAEKVWDLLKSINPVLDNRLPF